MYPLIVSDKTWNKDSIFGGLFQIVHYKTNFALKFDDKLIDWYSPIWCKILLEFTNNIIYKIAHFLDLCRYIKAFKN